jgi:hypothetical protein
MKKFGLGLPNFYVHILVLIAFLGILSAVSPQAMGATADFNNDSYVDVDDLSVFCSQWLNTPSVPSADFDFNGLVDFNDFALFAVQWLPHPVITISGTTGLEGVTINGLPDNPVTDSNGFYSDILPYGWSGTVTPTKSGYSFSPESISYTNITSDLPNRNFTASLTVTFTISGTTGVEGVTMNGLPGSPVTDSNGFYSAVLPYGWSGTVTPAKSGYSFSPGTVSYTNVTTDLPNRNFTATQATTFVIYGTTGVEGAIINGLPNNPVTDSNGFYRADLPHGWSGTVVPTKSGYRFSPESLSYINVNSDLPNRNFTASIADTVTISGTTGLEGVTMNGLPGSPVTDNNGFYSAVLPYGWSGTVAPTKTGYSFSPESISYTNVTSDLPNRDFTATQIVTFTISGTTGLEGVTMTGLPNNPVTDSNGYYSAVLPYGWSGTVTPTKSGYSFSPGSISYTNVTSDLPNRNFTASLIVTLTISGTTGLEGVIMNGLPGNPVTDSNGYYSAVVSYGWSGTVTPTKTGYFFSPVSIAYTNIVSDQPNKNFIATQLQLVKVAASDAPESIKAEANYVCDGTGDQQEINAAIRNNRYVVLSSGTFNINAAVIVSYNNIILEGQGASTIIKNTSGAQYSVLYQFGANHDITIRNLQIDNNDYGNAADAFNKCLFINGNFTTVIGSDRNKYLCIKAHLSSPDNRPVTGPNYSTYWSRVGGTGSRETWGEGVSYSGIDSCNNILIEGVTAHDSRAEVICVDYAEHITIRDCNTYNGVWSGITVAHTRHSEIYNNQVRHCGENPAAGYQMSRGINVIGSSYVSIYNNWIRDCMTGGIGVNETFGVVESENIDIYNNHIIDTIGTSGGIIVESSDNASYTSNVNIWGNNIDTYRQIKLDAGGTALDNGDGTVTLPATYNGYRKGLNVKIAGTTNYNGTYTLLPGTDDNHIVISHTYADELFTGTETVSHETIGMWFDHITNFSVRSNIVEPGTYSYWCYVTAAAYDGSVENNSYTPGRIYINKSPSVTFINNSPINP